MMTITAEEKKASNFGYLRAVGFVSFFQDYCSYDYGDYHCTNCDCEQNTWLQNKVVAIVGGSVV